jgi:GT2 family glycosyltransferase
MLTKVDNFNKFGGFSEKFFFGEEDVELSFRLKTLGKVIICDTRAVIYHKVGTSLCGDKVFLRRKAFIHYLNRFLNMRDQMSSLMWNIWRLIMAFKVAFTLNRKYSSTFLEIIKFVNILFIDSSRLSAVTKSYFQKVLNNGIGFGYE